MTPEEQKNCDECMKEINDLLDKRGCRFDVRVTFSSGAPPSFVIMTLPARSLVVANQMPKMKVN